MKYVAYLRAENKELGKNKLAIVDQRAIVAAFFTIGHEYEDAGPASLNNPGLQNAIALAQKPGWTLVAASPDRLADDAEDLVRIYRLVDGRLEICGLPDFASAQELASMYATVEGYQKRQKLVAGAITKERMRLAKIKRGSQYGTAGNLPLGPSRSGAARIERARAAYSHLLPMITELRAQGLSLKAVAKALNESGHQTRMGSPFHDYTIARILKREEGR